MEALLVGIVIGLAFGVTAVGFLAVGAYDRGFNAAMERRREWRAELVARQSVAHRPFSVMKKAS